MPPGSSKASAIQGPAAKRKSSAELAPALRFCRNTSKFLKMASTKSIVPFSIPSDTVAFEVEGESMWPRYDSGDVVICWQQSEDAENVVGREAAVRTRDGRPLSQARAARCRPRHLPISKAITPRRSVASKSFGRRRSKRSFALASGSASYLKRGQSCKV